MSGNELLLEISILLEAKLAPIRRKLMDPTYDIRDLEYEALRREVDILKRVAAEHSKKLQEISPDE